MNIYDIHTHSAMSDGTDAPEQVIRNAKQAGLALVALTDHDNVLGVRQALAEGARIGMPVLTGVELDTRFQCTLHILGVGIDLENEELRLYLEEAARRRLIRNTKIVNKLHEMGVDLQPHIEMGTGVMTRLNLALALVSGGYAKDKAEAFSKYLNPGCPAYFDAEHETPAESVRLIKRAGGLAILAHPCQIRANLPPIVKELAGAGLDGIEAYYPTTTDGLRLEHIQLAKQYGLMATCGCDYHGAHRPAAKLGCAWQDTPLLEQSYEILAKRVKNI